VLAVVLARIRWKAIQPFILFGYASGGSLRHSMLPGQSGTRDRTTCPGEIGLGRGENSFPSTRNKYVPCQLSSEEKEQTHRSHEMADAHEGLA
jgi:hypothetical protein